MRKWRCTFVAEPLNHIHQDTKPAWLIAVCKRSLTFGYSMGSTFGYGKASSNIIYILFDYMFFRIQRALFILFKMFGEHVPPCPPPGSYALLFCIKKFKKSKIFLAKYFRNSWETPFVPKNSSTFLRDKY